MYDVPTLKCGLFFYGGLSGRKVVWPSVSILCPRVVQVPLLEFSASQTYRKRFDGTNYTE